PGGRCHSCGTGSNGIPRRSEKQVKSTERVRPPIVPWFVERLRYDMVRLPTVRNFGKIMENRMLTKASCSAVLVAACCSAAAVQFPSGSLTVPGTASSRTSFVFSGTLTDADTIAFVQTGAPCLQ